MLVVALTGGIGSGKSEAGQIFQELGAVVVDSDQLSHDVLERGTPGFEEVLQSFGDQILTDGLIDRKKLGAIVFQDSKKLTALEKIIHPRVRSTFEEIVKSCEDTDVVINQIPLLVETSASNRFDRVIVVTAPLEIRRERLLLRGLRSYEIDRRLANQVSDEARINAADYVIYNSGTKEKLRNNVTTLYEKLQADATHN